MKQYSIKELIITAVLASFLTAAIFNPSLIVLPAKAALSDFFKQIPYLEKFFKEEPAPAVPEEFRPKPREETYEPAGYEAQVISAVKTASPAVVSIVITKNVPVIEQYYTTPFGDDPYLRQFFGDIQIPQFRQKGFEKKEVGGGTGFIVSKDGLILTNKHVVADVSAEYTVLTNEGQKYPAKVLARDQIADLAVIKIEAAGLPTLKLGDSENVRVGQTAIAIGNALGEFKNTVSAGVVSGLGRSVTAAGGGVIENIYDVIQTDASINPGNSGGPLLNLNGEVMGINTAMVSGAQSIGFAVPINQAKRIVSDVLSFGAIKTPYLGVRYLTVTPALKESKNLPFDYGALIAKGEGGEPAVIKDSPAEKSGLTEGDVILEFEGRKVDPEHPLISRINLYSVGSTVNLKVWRGGEIKTVRITLAEKP